MSAVATLPPGAPETAHEIIHDRLNQAHATLDLLFTLVTDHGTAGGEAGKHIEDLCPRTLEYSLHSAMLRIAEAQEAAGKLSAIRP
jgi:hypothetical protein